MCLAQGPQRGEACEARDLKSSTLPLNHCAPSRLVGILTEDGACHIPGKYSTPRVKFLYPTWTGSLRIVFIPLFEALFIGT